MKLTQIDKPSYLWGRSLQIEQRVSYKIFHKLTSMKRYIILSQQRLRWLLEENREFR